MRACSYGVLCGADGCLERGGRETELEGGDRLVRRAVLRRGDGHDCRGRLGGPPATMLWQLDRHRLSERATQAGDDLPGELGDLGAERRRGDRDLVGAEGRGHGEG